MRYKHDSLYADEDEARYFVALRATTAAEVSAAVALLDAQHAGHFPVPSGAVNWAKGILDGVAVGHDKFVRGVEASHPPDPD